MTAGCCRICNEVMEPFLKSHVDKCMCPRATEKNCERKSLLGADKYEEASRVSEE